MTPNKLIKHNRKDMFDMLKPDNTICTIVRDSTKLIINIFLN